MSTSIALPSDTHACEHEAGGIKKIKTENRRSDSTYLVDPRKLRIDPQYNVRVRTPSYLAHIRQIADSMIADGYDPGQPVTVVVVKQDGEDVMLIRAGNSRLEAALIAIEEGAGFDAIPVIIRPKSDNQIDQTVDLVKSNSGRPFSTYELAIVVKRLLNMELSEAEIHRRLNLAPSYINGLALLAGAPHKLAMLVVEEKVAAAVAIDLIRKHGNAKALETIEQSLAKATAAGKTKVTPSNLPEAAFKKAIKTKAPALLETAELIRQDAGFSQLAPETQERLSSLLDELAKLKAEQGTNPPPAEAGQGADAHPLAA